MHIHNGYLPGCIGRITALHAGYYAQAAGFGLAFEAKVASELAAFCLRLDPRTDGLWLALHGSEVHGAVVIDGSAGTAAGAHLRWFILSEALRGQGVGHQLLAQALDFCRAAGHARVHLWTFDGLHAARHLYEKHGFRLALQQRGTQWGRAVDEQRFDCVLGPAGPGSPARISPDPA